MSDPRSVHSVFMDMETVHLDLRRLASAVEIIGTHAKSDGIEARDGGAVEILGEAIGERMSRLVGLLEEAIALNRRAARG